MALIGADGAVVVDCAALQSPTSRGRGIGRYALEWAIALEAEAPDLVSAYLLDPALPPPGDVEGLLASGKVVYRTAGELPDRARILHSLSPLDLAVDLETIWPSEVASRSLRRSATVYDLIPAKDPATHLADLHVRHRYRVRLEALRASDQLHAISAGVGADLRAVLGVPAGRVVVAGAAPAARFRPSAGDAEGEDAGEAARSRLGVEGRYVLYPTGSHPRKNNEGLLRAWALLPAALRREVRLVLTGELPEPTAHHLRHMATRAGFPTTLVVAGVVEDDTLLALYRGAAVVCFPSLAEGYGLPVAEALACGTPVIGSDLPPLDELLPPEARFDAADDEAIAAALEKVLSAPEAGERLLAASPAPAGWPAVARRTAGALTALAASPRRARTPRRRLAFVSPFPPAESGVAGYSAHLVEALAGLGLFEIECFADGPTPGQVPPAGADACWRAGAFSEVAPLRGGFDEVVYTLGNSHHHLGALRALRRRPGVVIAHDVRLVNLYKHDLAQPGAEVGGLPAVLRRLYGDELPEGLGTGDDLRPIDLERFGLAMAREAIAASRRFLVSSEAAVALARVDATAADAGKIARLPFAFADGRSAKDFGDGPVEDAPAAPAEPGGPVVAHFGIVDPSKQPFVLLEAFAAARGRHAGARLAFVGPVSDTLAEELHRRAEALGVAAAVEVRGAVPAAAYAAALAEATLAVQLRAATNGEASAAIGDCLAAGLPTVVTGIGWARELPGEAVVHVERTIEPAALGCLLGDLLGDGRRRAALAAAGRAEAARRSFRAAAEALVELADLDARRRA